jgi:hypothetical protein
MVSPARFSMLREDASGMSSCSQLSNGSTAPQPLVNSNTSASTPKLTTGSVTPAQSFLGVGGSGVWLPHDLFNFPESVRWNLFSLLFSQTGLGLSNYRYNIGGGSVNVSNPYVPPETFYVASGRLQLERRPAISTFCSRPPPMASRPSLRS